MTDRQGRSELHYVALDGTAEDAVRLILAGEDVGLQDKDGCTPLHMAAQQKNTAVAEVLLAHGAPVDVVNKFGNSPLWTAVFGSKGEGEVIRLLRAAGADPHQCNASGRTPLELARLIGNYDVAQYFADLL
ncbi:ankyrin repeat domain-containing protein [Actinoplanes sp. NPDC004185]